MSHDRGAGDGTIRAAVIATDEDVREALSHILSDPGRGVTLGAEIALPFTEITEPWLDALREHGTELVFVDLEQDPKIGIKFAEFLMDAGMAGSMVAVGSDPSPELLLEAMRVGAVEFLRKPVERTEVEAAVERVRRKLGRGSHSSGNPTPPRGRTLAILAVKGGAGGTTVSANLAIEVHRLTRARTLLVDLDLELGDASLLLGMEPRFGLGDLVENFHRVDSGLLASYIERHESGIDLLAAPARPNPPAALDADRIRRILGFLRGQYDYVVVDTPKAFTPACLAALGEAGEIYLVATPDLGALRNLGRTLALLEGVAGRSNGNRESAGLRLVLNRFDPGQLITVSEIQETVGMEVFQTLRNDYRAVAEAMAEGRPVAMAGGSAFAGDVRELASEITGVRAGDGRHRGPLKRILSGLRAGWR